jgi:F-type H+-transporting ATPase subunit b
MDAILAGLGGLLLRALPTFFLLLLLHFYLKRVFFRPLDKVLESRRQATEGARNAAQVSLDAASQKSADYEAAIRGARIEIFREQEDTRRKWREDQATAMEQSRRSASETVKQARANIADEAAQATKSLAAESERLAGGIAEAILAGRRS